MKKYLLPFFFVFLLTIILTNPAFSAKGKSSMKVDAGVGYGLSPGGMPLGDQRTYSETEFNGVITDTTQLHKNIYGSLGQGLNIFAKITMGLNEFFEAGLGFNYLIGTNNSIESSFKTSQTQTSSSSSSGYNSAETINAKYWGSGFWLTPFLSVNAGMKTINPYIQFGLILGFMSAKYKADDSFTASGTGSAPGSASGSGTTEINWSGGMTLGYKGTAGVEFFLSKSMSIFAEFNLVSMIYKPDTRDASYNYSENGSMTSSNQLFTYNDTYTATSKTFTLTDDAN